MLHDAVEDQGGLATRTLILRLFGNEVTAIVDGCTDTVEDPKPPWMLRKQRYIAHLREAGPSVRLVAAKLANARSILTDLREIGEVIWDRFHCTRAESLWYYRSVVDALRGTPPVPLVEELERVVAEIARVCDGAPVAAGNLPA